MKKILKLEGLELSSGTFVDKQSRLILCLGDLESLVDLPRKMKEGDKLDLLISDEPKTGYFLVLAKRKGDYVFIATNKKYDLLVNNDGLSVLYEIDLYLDLGTEILEHFKGTTGRKKFYVRILVWERSCP